MARRKTATNIHIQKQLERVNNDALKVSTYNNAATEFLKHCRIKGLAPATIGFYAKELKQTRRAFAEIEVPLSDLRKIQTQHIEKFIEYQQYLGRAVNTINSRLRACRTFFNFCLRKEYIAANPFEGVQQLKTRHEVGPTFSKRQLKRLLDAPDVTTFSGLRDLAIMLTFAHTGIRLTELTSLRVQDITFDGKGAVTVQRTKNRYARRIPMTRRLKQVLRAYIQERGVLDTDKLFINVEDKPISERTIQARIKEYGEQTGVGKEVAVSPHAFRRTFCRLKVEAGTNIFLLQQLTGHHSLEILRRYVAIYSKDLEDVIEKGFEDI